MLRLRPTSVRRSSLLTVLAVAVVAAAFVSPAAQAASCANRTLTSPFSRFGDSNKYFLAPSGSFESGTAGWALSNAAVSTGNESFYLNATTDKNSLKLTGSALSPAFCITRDDPLLRFTAKTVTTAGSNGNYSQLNVSIIVRNAAGSQGTYFLGAISLRATAAGSSCPRCTTEASSTRTSSGRTASARQPCSSSSMSRARAVPGIWTTSTSIRSSASKPSTSPSPDVAPGLAGRRDRFGACGLITRTSNERRTTVRSAPT